MFQFFKDFFRLGGNLPQAINRARLKRQGYQEMSCDVSWYSRVISQWNLEPKRFGVTDVFRRPKRRWRIKSGGSTPFTRTRSFMIHKDDVESFTQFAEQYGWSGHRNRPWVRGRAVEEARNNAHQ